MNTDASPEAAAAASSNGPGAALLAAGVGALALGVIAILADRVPAIARSVTFYRPTSPLSGVTTTAIAIWLAVRLLLHRRWRRREVTWSRVSLLALALLILGFLLTFPPLADLF